MIVAHVKHVHVDICCDIQYISTIKKISNILQHRKTPVLQFVNKNVIHWCYLNGIHWYLCMYVLCTVTTHTLLSVQSILSKTIEGFNTKRIICIHWYFDLVSGVFCNNVTTTSKKVENLYTMLEAK